MKESSVEWPATTDVELGGMTLHWHGTAHAHFRMAAHEWAVLDKSGFFNQVYTLDPNVVELAWQLNEQFRTAFGYTQRAQELCQRLEKIESTLSALVTRLDRNSNPRQSLLIPIQSFAPEPYDVIIPFTVVVTSADDGYEAGFFEGNLFASGDTEEEAVRNLKSIMIETYDELGRLGDSKLGPEPLRQKQILARLIRKSGT